MSLLKSFYSLFDWMFPKSLEKKFEELDDSMQKLYTNINTNRQNDVLQQTYVYKNGRPVSLEEDMNITLTTSSEFLDEMSRLNPSGQFQPYAYYNKDMDAIESYFKDESCYTKTLNNNIELHISFETGEVVGMNILNIQKLMQDERHFK